MHQFQATPHWSDLRPRSDDNESLVSSMAFGNDKGLGVVGNTTANAYFLDSVDESIKRAGRTAISSANGNVATNLAPEM